MKLTLFFADDGRLLLAESQNGLLVYPHEAEPLERFLERIKQQVEADLHGNQ